MKVNICGIPHEVVEVEDNFTADAVHCGEICYKDLTIKVNKNMPQIAKDETICHEMVHGILVHLGFEDMSNDEHLVQALGNAIFQGFQIRRID